MSTQTQIRRGTATQCDALTPADGEVIYDQTNDRMRIGDGAKAGGFHQASAADVQNQIFQVGTTGGTTTAYTLTCTVPPAAYQAGQAFEFVPGSTNTGASTLNVNGVGAVAINKVSAGSLVAVAAGDLPAGIRQRVVYTGSVFQLMGGGSGITSLTAGSGLSGGTITSTGTIAIDTNNAAGIGSYFVGGYAGAGSLSSGSTTSVANLIGFKINLTSGIVSTGSIPASGTWRNISGYTMTNTSNTYTLGLFIRTA